MTANLKRRASGRRSSLKAMLSRSLSSISTFMKDPPRLPEDDQWEVGSFYESLYPITLRDEPGLLSREVCEIPVGTKVLIMAIMVTMRDNKSQVQRGFIQDALGDQGWLSFETKEGIKLLSKSPTADGWKVGGRYCISLKTTLRKGVQFDSPSIKKDDGKIRQLRSLEEVVILSFGVSGRLDSGVLCLSALVHTRQGEVGWISCFSEDEVPILMPDNLLVKNSSAGAAQSSGKLVHPADTNDWEVGGKYRAVQDLALRSGPEFNSRRLGLVNEGECVVVSELKKVKRKEKRTLRACIKRNNGKCGWVSCMDQDGDALLDCRDHLEYDKVSRSISLKELRTPMLPQRSEQDEIEEEMGFFVRKRGNGLKKIVNFAKSDKEDESREAQQWWDEYEAHRGNGACTNKPDDLSSERSLEESSEESSEDESQVYSDEIADDDHGRFFTHHSKCLMREQCFFGTCGAFRSQFMKTSETLIETLTTDGLEVKAVFWDSSRAITTENATLFVSTESPELILMTADEKVIIDLRGIERLALGKDRGNLPMLEESCCTLILQDEEMLGLYLQDVSSRDRLAQVIKLFQESAGSDDSHDESEE